MNKTVLTDLIQTRSFASRLAKRVVAPITIALQGTLGAGKTQFARYFCAALDVPEELVTSPTYVLLQRYLGSQGEIYHFDFYRLATVQQVWDLGFDELQEQPAILLVEWADKFPETLPAQRIEVRLEPCATESKTARTIELTATTDAAQKMIADLCD